MRIHDLILLGDRSRHLRRPHHSRGDPATPKGRSRSKVSLRRLRTLTAAPVIDRPPRKKRPQGPLPPDPPPIVQLKLFQVHHSAQTETEIDYECARRRAIPRPRSRLVRSELQSYGILCHADLFPVPLPDTDVDGDDARDRRSSMLPETDPQGTQAGSNIIVASAHFPASSAPSSSRSSSGSDLRPRGIPHQNHRQTP
ncbi:hypothetical protein AcV5_002863 [Taiwanofungus camphoratus]|nr:hypothetical protein AcV5_002863 [Antrodia cinnamomea]